jgi:hypothetical protein
MRHIGIVASSAPQASAPSITINSVTNFNQDRATLNATVNPNGATTSVKFQISTNNSTWTDVTTITGLTGNSQSTYHNHTGLSNGTLYYIRAIATNSAGSSTSSSTSFTTWSLKTYGNATVGTHYQTISTITPTGGTAVVPSILNLFIAAGGGGGGGSAAGGGGGVTTLSSRSFNNTNDLILNIVVGGGGGAGSAGGGSSISGASFTTASASGGNAGGGSYTSSGSSGNGNAAGTGAQYYDPGSGQTPIETLTRGAGGGGGAGGTGGNGNANASGAIGGNGGAGVYSSTYGVGAGAGGGGGAEENSIDSTVARGAVGSHSTYGAGGSGGLYNDNALSVSPASGGSGVIYFQYYGP